MKDSQLEEAEPSLFVKASRQEFRQYFQPTRIMLGVLPADTPSGLNIITLCFHMYCSYRPPMLAFAIEQGSLSHELIRRCHDLTVAVPGEALVDEALFCGINSGRDVDKVAHLGLPLIGSTTVSVPSLAGAIAIAELSIESQLATGDHILTVAQVERFLVNPKSRELPLLSVGPRTAGYRVLAKSGIHRLGVVDV